MAAGNLDLRGLPRRDGARRRRSRRGRGRIDLDPGRRGHGDHDRVAAGCQDGGEYGDRAGRPDDAHGHADRQRRSIRPETRRVAHRRRRRGPNGLPLLTDIATVHEASDSQPILIFEDAASTSVLAAVAVANEGDSAKLSDHARATVGPLPVVIQDRQVDDATMTVGSKVLRSDAARFSKLDIGATVTIERGPSSDHHRAGRRRHDGAAGGPGAADGRRRSGRRVAPGVGLHVTLLTGLQTAESGAEPVEIVFGPAVPSTSPTAATSTGGAGDAGHRRSPRQRRDPGRQRRYAVEPLPSGNAGAAGGGQARCSSTCASGPGKKIDS